MINRPNKIILILTLLAFIISPIALIPRDAEAIGIPFGGPSVFGIPCTCSLGQAVWFWDYGGTINPLGLWVYPGANFKSSAQIFLTPITIPGIQALGSYIPVGVGQCLVYAGITCVPIPLTGMFPPIATPPGVGSSGLPLGGIGGIGSFASFAGMAKSIYDKAVSSGRGGGKSCLDEGRNCRKTDFNSGGVEAFSCRPRESRETSDACDNKGPVGLSCSPDVPIIEEGGSVKWKMDMVGGGNEKHYLTWQGKGVTAETNAKKTTLIYEDKGIQSVEIIAFPKSDLQSPIVSTCSVQVVEKNSSTTVVGCSTSKGVVSNISANDRYPDYNKKIEWKAKALGGEGPYTYSWTGEINSDKTSVTVNYKNATLGEKTAVVTAVSADGQTASATCSIEVVGE
ncbi:MAG: hypothetical protein ACI9GH_000658 [Candidatus Paceibacteria bacterium]|jgi:hypothetical protein